MDQALKDMVAADRGPDASRVETEYRFIDLDSGEIEIDLASGPIRYTLKPLRDLYGQGQGGPTVSPQDERYQSLFMSIEQEIAAYDDKAERLTDGLVQLTLERMSMDPAAECGQDALCSHLQAQLRFLLSLKDYSRQELKTALRTIARSVARHKNMEGRRGYIEFIHEFFG